MSLDQIDLQCLLLDALECAKPYQEEREIELP